MKKKENEILSWFLITISPITFGVIIVLLIYILIAKYYNLNCNEYGSIFIPMYLCYCFVWSRICHKVIGTSWLE